MLKSRVILRLPLELDGWICSKGLVDEDMKLVLFYGLLLLVHSYKLGNMSYVFKEFRYRIEIVGYKTHLY